jgi:prepilin-type N-terminal cleavage/methylation domain-containing protein
MSWPGSAERGFTLLELLVVLLVLGAVLAAVAPRFGLREARLDAAVRTLAAELERVRGRAVDGARIETVGLADLARLLPAGLRLVAEGPMPLRSFPDGTATPARLRIEAGEDRAYLRIEPTTGRILRGDG